MKIYIKGFTLIELLVVISIISFLASVVAVSTNTARAKAEDTAKVAQTKSVQTAFALYHSDHGTMPPNFDCSSSSGCVPVASRSSGIARETTDPESEESLAYNASMQVLVDGGYLGGIPESIDGTYGYYNYGSGSPMGAIFTADLKVLLLPSPTPECNMTKLQEGLAYGPFIYEFYGFPNSTDPDAPHCEITYNLDESPDPTFEGDCGCVPDFGRPCACMPY